MENLQFCKLKIQEELNKATHEDKIMIERYMAIKKLRLDEIELYESDDDYDDDSNVRLSEKLEMERNLRNNLLQKHYCDISKIENLRSLNQKQNQDDNRTDDNNYDVNVNKKKFKIIIDVLNNLGYKDISDKSLIERKDFETNMNKVISTSELFTNPHNTNVLFGLNKKVNKVDSIRSFMGFINSLFIEFGFTIKVKQKSIRINKEKVNSNYYYIHFVNEANEFI